MSEEKERQLVEEYMKEFCLEAGTVPSQPLLIL